jgi:hypothetical protein
MNSIRLKVTIHLNRNHALNIQDLNALKPLVERGIAASLPDSISVDTIRVTKVKETTGHESTSNSSVAVDTTVKRTRKTRATAS